MNRTNHDISYEESPLGITIAFCNTPGGYHPSHWHEEMELLYPLNGEAAITVEHTAYKLSKKNVTVVESCKIHSTLTYDDSMFLRILIRKELLEYCMPGITLCSIHCIPEQIDEAQFPEYYKICELLATLTRLYIQDTPSFRMEAECLILQAISRLVRFFSTKNTLDEAAADPLSVSRIRSIIRYAEQHYHENISLQDAAAHIGISREYFCRLFKQNIGVSFLRYLNDLRLSKAYHDLQYCDLSISEIMEKNGFSGQKQFNRTFKERYGCTPSSVRNAPKNIR